MEGGCSVCGSPNTGYICGCTDPPTRLCLECMDTHLEEEKDHAMKKVKAKPLIGSETCAVCYLCKAAFASLFCCCAFPVLVLCGACKTLHVRKNSACIHPMFPVSEVNKVNSIEDVERVKIKVVHGHMAEERLRQNVLEVKKCEERIVQCTQELITVIEARRDELLKQLSDIQSEFLLSLESAVSEVQRHVLDKDFPFDNALSSWIQSFNPKNPVKASQLFTYEVECETAKEVIMKEFKVECAFQSVNRPKQSLPEECQLLLTQVKEAAISLRSQQLLTKIVDEWLENLKTDWNTDVKAVVRRQVLSEISGAEITSVHFQSKVLEENVFNQLCDEVCRKIESLPLSEVPNALSVLDTERYLKDRLSKASIFTSKKTSARLTKVISERISDFLIYEGLQKQLATQKEKVTEVESTLTRNQQVSITLQEKNCKLESLCAQSQHENDLLKVRLSKLDSALNASEKANLVSKEEFSRLQIAFETGKSENLSLRDTLSSKELSLQKSYGNIQDLQGKLKDTANNSKKNTAKKNAELMKELQASKEAMKEMSLSITEARDTNESLRNQLKVLEKKVKSSEEEIDALQSQLNEKITECAELSNALTHSNPESAQEVLLSNEHISLQEEFLLDKTDANLGIDIKKEAEITEVPQPIPVKIDAKPPSSTVLRFISSGITLIELDTASKSWNSKVLDVNTGADESTSFCYITNQLLFGCGGTDTRRAFTVRFEKRQVRMLAEMTTERRFPGVVSYDRAVFAFGGIDRMQRSLRTCEKYSLEKNEWLPLLDMSSPRAQFSPCFWNRKIHLIGGNSDFDTVEIFDVGTGRFEAISMGLREVFLSIPQESSVLLISQMAVYEWDWDSWHEPVKKVEFSRGLNSVVTCAIYCLVDGVLTFLEPVLHTVYTVDLRRGLVATIKVR